MKHNFVRPVVKFIEDDLVASGIGGATGPARFFAARGAGLLGDGVNKTFGSGDTRTWSAWDNMFYTRSGAKRLKRTMVKRRGRPMYRRRRTMLTRRRTYRRKSAWGTRVRRAALRMSESKRHQTTTTEELIDDQQLDTTAICRVPDLNQGASAEEGLRSKIHRNGQTIITTGIASWVHLRNVTQQPMKVDLIWFYKKRDVSNVQSIYKETQFENVTAVGDPTSYFGRMIQTIGNMNTVVLKRMTVTLTETAETMGTDCKMLRVWIPFKKVMKFNYTLEGGVNQDYDVHFGVIPHNREGVPFSTGSGDGTENVLRAQHRHVCYFRDP